VPAMWPQDSLIFRSGAVLAAVPKMTSNSSNSLTIGSRRVELRTPSGMVVLGVALNELAKHFALSPAIVNQSCITWNFLVGPDSPLGIGSDAIHDEMRRSFSWHDLVLRCASALAALGASATATDRTQASFAEDALRDNWPAAVIDCHVFLERARRAGRPIITASELGLLWLLSNALEEPWDEALSPLAGTEAHRRFGRLAMMSSDGLNPPSHLVAGQTMAAVATVTPFATARVLRGAGRLSERDDVVRFLVRAYELYVELVPTAFAEAGAIFERAASVAIDTWIIQVCGLVHLMEQECGIERRKLPVVDLGADGRRHPARDVARILSRPREDYAALMMDCRRRAADQTLALEPLRRFPLLRLSAERYVVLHDDFLLGAADDGIFYTVLDALEPRKRMAFRVAVGNAVETYAFRCLNRVARDVPDSAVARVDTANGLRCDFAMRLGNDLVLFETKRANLESKAIMGGTEADELYIEQFGKGCKQILQTKVAIDRDGLHRVAPTLELPIGWKPSRVIGVLLCHRPNFLWYSSFETLLKECKLTELWRDHLAGLPVIWSLSDLELLGSLSPRPVLPS
jgi:hypothetical protein